MKNLNKKTAVILFNLGGPDKPESVRKFLFNLFNDPAIIPFLQPFRFLLAQFISRKREQKAQDIYAKIGGKSPLYELTMAQAYALERELSYAGNFKVYVAMRYWKPFAKEVVEQVRQYDPDQMILLPLYPQFSSATSDSSIKDYAEQFLLKHRKSDKQVITKVVCCYPVEPDLIKAHTLLIKQTIMKFYENDFSKFRFLFSAHGLPQKLINKGDPYVFHVTKTTNAIIKNLAEIFAVSEEKIDAHICYQSKVGPMKWTSPSLDQEIKRAALDKKIPVIIPVSFVSDHSETLVELDIDYKNMAEKFGIKTYLRVPSLNADGHFIKALTKICQNVDATESSIFSGEKAVRICPKKMRLCFNRDSDCAS